MYAETIKLFFTSWGSFMIAGVKKEDENSIFLEYPGYIITPQQNSLALVSPFNFCKNNKDLLKSFVLKKEHIVFQSDPEDIIMDAYEKYRAKAYQEETGIVTPPKSGNLSLLKGRQ